MTLTGMGLFFWIACGLKNDGLEGLGSRVALFGGDVIL